MKKLPLRKERLRALSATDLSVVQGGYTVVPATQINCYTKA